MSFNSNRTTSPLSFRLNKSVFWKDNNLNFYLKYNDFFFIKNFLCFFFNKFGNFQFVDINVNFNLNIFYIKVYFFFNKSDYSNFFSLSKFNQYFLYFKRQKNILFYYNLFRQFSGGRFVYFFNKYYSFIIKNDFLFFYFIVFNNFNFVNKNLFSNCFSFFFIRYLENYLSFFLDRKVFLSFVNCDQVGFVNSNVYKLEQSKQLTNCYSVFYKLQDFPNFLNLLNFSFISFNSYILNFYICSLLSFQNNQHRFLTNLSFLLSKYLFLLDSSVVGLKIKIKGRINGRLRRSVRLFVCGDIVPQSTVNCVIDYSFNVCFTKHGVLGVKIWYKGLV